MLLQQFYDKHWLRLRLRRSCVCNIVYCLFTILLFLLKFHVLYFLIIFLCFVVCSYSQGCNCRDFCSDLCCCFFCLFCDVWTVGWCPASSWNFGWSDIFFFYTNVFIVSYSLAIKLLILSFSFSIIPLYAALYERKTNLVP